jgi:hypothetical protein
MTTVKYGLRIKGTEDLLTYSSHSNAGGDFCVSTEYTIGNSKYDPVWLVDRQDTASKAATTNTPWYNADYDSPSHESWIEDAELEVVEVTLVQTVKVC